MLEWTRGRRPWEGGQKGRPGSQRETGAMGRQGGHTDHSNSAVESDSDGGAEIHREIAGSLPQTSVLGGIAFDRRTAAFDRGSARRCLLLFSWTWDALSHGGTLSGLCGTRNGRSGRPSVSLMNS